MSAIRIIKFRLLTQTGLWMEPFRVNRRVEDAYAVTQSWYWMHMLDTRNHPLLSDCSKLCPGTQTSTALGCKGCSMPETMVEPKARRDFPQQPLSSSANCPQGVRVNQDFVSLPSSLKYFSVPQGLGLSEWQEAEAVVWLWSHEFMLLFSRVIPNWKTLVVLNNWY